VLGLGRQPAPKSWLSRQRDAALQPDEPEEGAECLTGVAQVAWAAQRRSAQRPTGQRARSPSSFELFGVRLKSPVGTHRNACGANAGSRLRRQANPLTAKPGSVG